MLSPIPRRSGWAYSCSLTQPYQPSPKWQSGRPAHCPFRGLLGVHSRYGLHTRAVTVYRDTLSEGFSHFVTSMTAPVASGWSGCRVGLAPTGKRRLVTAHARNGLMHRSKIAFYSITSSARCGSEQWHIEPQRLGGLEVDRQLEGFFASSHASASNVGCSARSRNCKPPSFAISTRPIMPRNPSCGPPSCVKSSLPSNEGAKC